MKGERRSKRKGQSVEFADFRAYVPGDDLRTIDWNLYARLDKLIVKLFLEEEDLHFYTLIDESRSMDFGEPTKLDYAKQLAAALGFIGFVGGAPARAGGGGGGRGEPVPLAEGIKNFGLRNPGRGVVVLVSDLMDKSGYEAGLRYLVSQRMDVYVIHLLSQEELEPDVKGDLKLVDCEDQDVAEISVSAPLLARYQATLNAFTGGAQEFCSRRGMNYLLANNQTPVKNLISNYLRRRGLVR